MAILTSTDWPDVRAALDINLDSTLLPDSTIGLTVYHGAVELEILRRDPDAATRTGEDATRIRLAAIYLLAARLAPAIPQIIAQSLSTGSFQAQGADWKAKAQILNAQAGDLIREVTGESRVSHFTLGAGRRGVW